MRRLESLGLFVCLNLFACAQSRPAAGVSLQPSAAADAAAADAAEKPATPGDTPDAKPTPTHVSDAGAAATDMPAPGTSKSPTEPPAPPAADGGSRLPTGSATAADDPNSVTVAMDEFMVEPNSEVFMCQDFPNPFGGADVAVGRTESTMTPGSHHLHVYYGMDSPASVNAAQCANPNEFRPMIHLATIAHQVSEYDAGTAAKLKGSAGMRFMAHYVNSTDQPLKAAVTLKLTKVDPSTVTRWVAQMHFNRIALSIPPNGMQDVTTTCTIPSTYGTIGLLQAVSHMHKHATHFTAKTSTGVALLDTSEWDEAPPMNYDTPVMLKPGDSITWSCTFHNDTSQTITYGDSAIKNEMCIYIARFFSSPSGDDLECETPIANAMAVATKNVAGM